MAFLASGGANPSAPADSIGKIDLQQFYWWDARINGGAGGLPLCVLD